ncbi:glucan endo-1,3-beta-glucosidase 8-like [Panicum hallii]|uniref:glucan endo-1,3-beta-glucosidase 8-like n=1 Tax=Panicum hallii TaxID=206008 RepID=UPI000DF4D8D2|nr:glucan endo-1,3-beta-glucosidase 8-like [Panicum hallii]XP_025805104.1 glucan endo-1,3-beta-glucosidase 8-like [Panicum hallii]
MAPRPAAVALAVALFLLLLPAPAAAAAAVGVNWGTMMSHPIHPSAVVEMLRANDVDRVKLFDADPWTVAALAGSGVQTMLAAPNDQLESLARDPRRARDWVRHNVTANLNAGVDVRYVAVGNEPFLKSYNGSFINITFPALKNMQKALNEAGFGQGIKVVVPLNADIYSSPENKPVPSAGSFRKDINDLMVDIVNFLHVNDAPFVVNIYPFLSLYQNPNFPLNFSFFDGATKPVYDQGVVYTNVFDANFDTLVWSLRKAGVPDMRIIVGEVGWPTDGDKNANVKYAQRFYSGFLKKMAKNVGTPLRPGHMEVYLFALIDENQKSVLPGRFERHWGLFTYDGKPKFSMDLSGNGKVNYLAEVKGVQYLPSQWCVFNKDAKDKYKDLPASVNYACSNADCTPLGYGSSCNGLSHDGNISYAFNIYFQTMDQDVRACSFGGLAKITTTNASQGGCLFPVQILSVSGRVVPLIFLPLSLVLLVSVFTLL